MPQISRRIRLEVCYGKTLHLQGFPILMADRPLRKLTQQSNRPNERDVRVELVARGGLLGGDARRSCNSRRDRPLAWHCLTPERRREGTWHRGS
jgi:hypothetical protein